MSSSVSNKELGIAAGIAVTSFVAGNLVARWMQKPSEPKKVDDEKAAPTHYKNSRDADEYVMKHSLREPAILKELREHTLANVPMGRMVSDPCACQFYRLLLNMLDAKKCIEVCVFLFFVC